MTWYLYIARCGDSSLYTGVTTDPQKRLQQHNAGQGSAYVRSKGLASLAYIERCPNKSTAHRRESEVKSWCRQKKLALIHGNNASFMRDQCFAPTSY